MDYSSTYFNKSLQELTYADVEDFFSVEREESDQIEFKSHHPSIQDVAILGILSKAVASFLNSSGGLVIWGAPQEVKGKGAKHAKDMFKGQLTDIPATYTKDSIVSRISDKIVPLPSGIRVRFIEGEGTQRVCIIEVDESPTSPHQTAGVYLMRIDGQKRNAPHAYVEALFKKITYPNLEAYIIPERLMTIESGYSLAMSFAFFNKSLFDNEEDFSFKVKVYGGYFSEAEPLTRGYSNSLTDAYSHGGVEYRPIGSLRVLHYGQPHIDDKIIIFHKSDLAKQRTARVNITFGGKKSPMKITSYEIDFDKRRGNNMKNTYELYKPLIINKIISDWQAEIGSTDDDILNALGVIR